MALAKKNTRLIILIGILALILIFAIYSKNANKSILQLLNNNKISLVGVDNFKIKEISDNGFVAESAGEIIKIEIASAGDKITANDYINKEIALFQGIFEPHLPPYPEFLTKEASCAEKYKPIASEYRYGKSFILYAGSRLGYGICADDLVAYRATLNYFYCKNSNKVFKVEYFISKKEKDQKLIDFNNSFTCK